MFLRAGRSTAWEGAPGPGSCFCCYWEARDNRWGTALPIPQQELPPHTALSTGTAIGTATAAFSYSLPGWCHLSWLKIRLEDISSGTGKISAKGKEFMMHWLWVTETVPCNLPNHSFCSRSSQTFPCAFLTSSKQWRQSRLLFTDRIGPALRRTRHLMSFALPFCTSPDFPDAESQKTGEFYSVTRTL